MKKGFAMISVLAIVLVLALGTATVLQSIGSQINMKTNNTRDLECRYLAEAGMQYALWKCRTSGCLSGTTNQVDDYGVSVPTETKTDYDSKGTTVKHRYYALSGGTGQYNITVTAYYSDV